jgi:hypothetical protein
VILRVLGLSLALLMTAACGAGPSTSAVTQAGASFERLLAAEDQDGACRLLSPSAHDDIEDDCSALKDLPHAQGQPDAQVRGRVAVLRYAEDVVFLSRYPGSGWLVIAAGCERSSQDEPYSCTVDGG